MLEHIIINQFVNGLNNEDLRKRVIFKISKNLIDLAQFARFLKLVVWVASNHSTFTLSPSTVSSLGFRGRGSSSGPRMFASSGRKQSMTRDFRDSRWQLSWSRTRLFTRTLNVQYGVTRIKQWPRFKQILQQSLRAIKWLNCQKLRHFARDCRNRSGNGYN